VNLKFQFFERWENQKNDGKGRTNRGERINDENSTILMGKWRKKRISFRTVM
jgi:hypothetical protein